VPFLLALFSAAGCGVVSCLDFLCFIAWCHWFDFCFKSSAREKAAKMVSKMAISGAKRLVPPWFQKCILYLDMKAILYCTSSTIGDDRSIENQQKGPSFLLMKMLAEKKNVYAVVRGLREQEEVKGVPTGVMVNETRQQLKRQ
jgi:hypothetical protein